MHFKDYTDVMAQEARLREQWNFQSLVDKAVLASDPEFFVRGLPLYSRVKRWCLRHGATTTVVSNYHVHEWVIVSWIRQHLSNMSADQLVAKLMQMGALRAPIGVNKTELSEWGTFHLNVDVYGPADRFAVFAKLDEFLPTLYDRFPQTFFDKFTAELRAALKRDVRGKFVRNVVLGTHAPPGDAYWLNPVQVHDVVSNNSVVEGGKHLHANHYFVRRGSGRKVFRFHCEAAEDEAHVLYFEIKVPVSMYVCDREGKRFVVTEHVRILRIGWILPEKANYDLRTEVKPTVITFSRNLTLDMYSLFGMAHLTGYPLPLQSLGILFAMLMVEGVVPTNRDGGKVIEGIAKARCAARQKSWPAFQAQLWTVASTVLEFLERDRRFSPVVYLSPRNMESNIIE